MYPLDGILYIFWITFLILHQKPFNLPCNSQWMIWWCKQSPWHFISLLRLIFARSVLGLVVLTLVRLKTLQTFQTFCQLNYSIMILKRSLLERPVTMKNILSHRSNLSIRECVWSDIHCGLSSVKVLMWELRNLLWRLAN